MGARRAGNLDLGVVGNCEVSALIDARGRLVWMCLPRPDGSPAFSALLTDRLGETSQGVFAVDLVDCSHAEQRYVRNTAILETVLCDTRGGSIRVTDFCPRFRKRGRMFRPMMLIRLIERLAGRPMIRIRLRPTHGFTARPAKPRSGSHHVRYSSDGIRYRITTDAPISALTEDRPIVMDEHLAFVLGADDTIEEAPVTLARAFLQQTRVYWQDWVRSLAVPFDWQEAVIRAAITLKLCTYEDTGAVLAALTSSIPESPGTQRTWDYRYCWLRDSYFVIQALNRLGATRTMEGYLHYIDHIVAQSGGVLRPLYRIAGDADLAERRVDTLEGFLGMGPVRIGNAAAYQTQRDVYGAVILAASQLFFDERLTRPGDMTLFTQLEPLGERAAAGYDLPDAGPWEFRSSEQVHTFSAAMSWAGCDRLARIATRLGLNTPAQTWQARAASMRARILDKAWNERRQTFAASFGGEALDATSLLLPDLGILPATDPRFGATLEAVGRELRDGDLLFRYRHPDDFGTPAAAFTVCAFWYVNALAAVGDADAAHEHFNRLLGYRNSLGLLSEHLDVASGELWGNYPQTYSLVGVITSALRLSRPWEGAV